MADQGTIETVAKKFQQWAETLAGDEQEALAEWMDRGWNDVSAHRADPWWQEPKGWEKRWSAGWDWS